MAVTTPTNHKRGPKQDVDLLDKAKLVNSQRKHFARGLFHAPQDDPSILELALDLEEWAMEDDALIIEDFILSKRIKPTSFYTLARDNQVMNKALTDAKYAISMRYQRLLKNNPIYLQKMLPYFHAQMNQWEIDKTKAAKQAEPESKIQYVIVEKGDS